MPRADHAFRVTLQAVSGVALLFSAGAFVRAGADAALSTFLGGATAVLNLMAMRRILGSLVAGTAEGSVNRGKVWASLAVLKLFGLFVGISILLMKGIAAPLPFLFGYVALPVGIVVGTLLARGGPDDDGDHSDGDDRAGDPPAP